MPRPAERLISPRAGRADGCRDRRASVRARCTAFPNFSAAPPGPGDDRQVMIHVDRARVKTRPRCATSSRSGRASRPRSGSGATRRSAVSSPSSSTRRSMPASGSAPRSRSSSRASARSASPRCWGDDDGSRPAAAGENTLDLDGALAVDHYWWLAYEWENLYRRARRARACAAPASPSPARARDPAAGGARRRGAAAARPVRGPARAAPRSTSPTATSSATTSAGASRATCSGSTAGSSSRRGARTLAAGLRGVDSAEDRRRRALEPCSTPRASTPALRRQRITELPATRERGPGRGRAWSGRRSRASVGARSSSDRQASARSLLARAPPAGAATSRAPATSSASSCATSASSTSSTDLAARRPAAARPTRAPWLMLLGENGLGKSTVLQAVALALLDERARESLGLDAVELLRSGTRRATVRVHLTGSPAPIELVARSGSRHFEGGRALKVLLLGYGATRLLPTAEHPAIESRDGTDGLARVENLFDPFTPIGDATSWLLGAAPRSASTASRSACGACSCSPTTSGCVRDRRNGRVLAEGDGDARPAGGLSAGYQSVIALATDVMKVVLRHVGGAEGRRGDRDRRRARRAPAPALADADRRGAARRVPARAVPRLHARPALPARAVDGEVVVLRHNSEGRVVALDDLPPRRQHARRPAARPRSTSASAARWTPRSTRCSPSTTC